MKIGTDISLSECKREGYTMIEFKVRELYPNGRKNGINKDHYVSVTEHYPDYIIEEDAFYKGLLMTDTIMSWDDALESYLSHEDGMNSSCETDKFINFENPTEYDLLNLISDLSSYCGLD